MFDVTTKTFTAHAVDRFNERIRHVGYDDTARREMLSCLSAASPDDVVSCGSSVRVLSGCCTFVFADGYGHEDAGMVVTVLPPTSG